jgi:hypothetical protein
VTNGSDTALNYGASWTNGSGGGAVFGPWSFSSAGNGAFLFGNPNTNGIGGMGTKTFQFRGSGISGNNFATANRSLSQPLQVGQILSFQWGINWDCQQQGGNKGFAVLVGTNEIVTVNNGTNSDITFNGINTGFGYGTNAMRWAFKLLTANSLQVTANDRDGNGTFNTNITVPGAPSAMRFYAANMSTEPNREPYFDDFKIEGSSYNNMHVAAPKGFGLWASGGSVAARRSLPSALATGDVLTIRIDNNFVDPAAKVGVALATAAGGNRFNFYFTGGGTSYMVDDTTTGRNTFTTYTDSGLLLTFTMTGSNTYSLSTGGSKIDGTLAVGEPLTQLVVYNNNAGSGAERNFYVGEMTMTKQQTTDVIVSVAAPTIVVQSASSIPESWWSSYEIPLGERNPTDDRDADGFTNEQEYLLGTDPTDRGSAFRITSVLNNGTNSTVAWSSVVDKTYRLQAKANLSDSWADVETEVTATGASSSDTHAASGQYFYRVRLVPPAP